MSVLIILNVRTLRKILQKMFIANLIEIKTSLISKIKFF